MKRKPKIEIEKIYVKLLRRVMRKSKDSLFRSGYLIGIGEFKRELVEKELGK